MCQLTGLTGFGERDPSEVVSLFEDCAYVFCIESFRTGAGACKTWAAVGPFVIELAPGLRAGGVTEPARTGKSSAFGTRC